MTSSVYAITCGGLGDVWRLESWEEALENPLIQYGDLIIRDKKHFLRAYTQRMLIKFVPGLGDEGLSAALCASKKEDWERTMSLYSDQLWNRVEESAKNVPTDPVEVLKLIRENRRRDMTEAATAEKAAKAEPKEKKEKVPAAPRGISDDAKITFGTDADGKKYGPENNPKRAGSKAHEVFSKYKEGMTFGKFAEAVGDRGTANTNARYDADKGFIVITA